VFAVYVLVVSHSALQGSLSVESSIRQTLIVVVASSMLVAVVIIAAKTLGLEAKYIDFLTWAQGTGVLGLAITGLLLVASVVFLLPSIYLTMGAGLLFGVVQGSFLVVVAETIGAIIAYGVGRLAGSSSARRLLQNKALSKINSVVENGGWEIIAATRMVPFFPFKLSNYAFGCSSVVFRKYVLGTFVGLWPITIFNVYLGSIAGDIMSIGRSGRDRTPFEWLVYTSGFAIVLVLLLITARLAHKRLRM